MRPATSNLEVAPWELLWVVTDSPVKYNSTVHLKHHNIQTVSQNIPKEDNYQVSSSVKIPPALLISTLQKAKKWPDIQPLLTPTVTLLATLESKVTSWTTDNMTTCWDKRMPHTSDNKKVKWLNISAWTRPTTTLATTITILFQPDLLQLLTTLENLSDTKTHKDKWHLLPLLLVSIKHSTTKLASLWAKKLLKPASMIAWSTIKLVSSPVKWQKTPARMIPMFIKEEKFSQSHMEPLNNSTPVTN